jgi:hypothetical protein
LSYELDSHTSIADYYGYKAEKEDLMNKYEYNPLTKIFTIDKLNTTDDSAKIEKFCNGLNFKKIVPELILKPIIHPFNDIKTDKVTPADLKLVKQWASVGDSVGASVWASVWASVGASVWDSVRASVRASVGASVRASVWDSVRAYTGTFFILPRSAWKYTENIDTEEYPFQCLATLWEQGLVPSFDGTTWRLHGGKDAKILYTITKEELMKK